MRFVVPALLMLSLVYPLRTVHGAEGLGLPAGAQNGKSQDNPPSENPEQKPSKKTLANLDVINMIHAGLADDTVVLDIQTSPTDFDTSPQALIFLQREGVSQTVMNAMLAAANGKPGTPVAAPAPASPSAAGPAKSGPAAVTATKQKAPDFNKIRKVYLEMDWAEDETARPHATLAIQKHTCLKVVDSLDAADAKLNWSDQGLMGVAIKLLSKDDKPLWFRRGLTPPLKALRQLVGCE
jgi:hypothetical protein